MITIIVNQQEQRNVFLSGQTGKALTDQCSQQFGFQVKLYYDEQFQHPIQQNQQLFAQNWGGKVVYAQRVENSTYGQVTCWFNIDGIDKEEGVSLRSDFTIEEVIQDAAERGIIDFNCDIDYKVVVTDNQKQKLASLKLMQMFKLIDQNDPKPELIIFLKKDGQEQTNITQPTITQPIFPQPQQSQFQFSSKPSFQPPISQSIDKNNSIPIPMKLEPPSFNTFPNQSTTTSFTQFNTQPMNQQFKIQPEVKQQDQKQTEIKQQPIIKKEQGIAISQPLSQNQDDNQEIMDEAKKALKQMIIFKNVSVIIDQSGQYVNYKYHLPKQIEGTFMHSTGKIRTIFTQNWIEISGIKIQEINDGFAIEWKDGKQNSISVKQQ